MTKDLMEAVVIAAVYLVVAAGAVAGLLLLVLLACRLLRGDRSAYGRVRLGVERARVTSVTVADPDRTFDEATWRKILHEEGL